MQHEDEARTTRSGKRYYNVVLFPDPDLCELEEADEDKENLDIGSDDEVSSVDEADEEVPLSILREKWKRAAVFSRKASAHWSHV
ncbi:hypothetical protein Ciccas_014579, partial [Cichlidogyrus casuarinus]